MTTTNNNDKNGRQPPLPNNCPPPWDPRAGNVPEQQRPICRKFIWGTCTKATHCKFRHDLDIEEMKNILKFCHDFQNKQGCGRPDCTYLHASKDEENQFRLNNQIPPILLERYAALALADASHMQSFEGVPQMMMYLTAPPPPPPPPAQMLPAAVAPPPPPPPLAAPAFLPLQQPPPPPPPPPPTIPPPTPVVHSVPVFSGPLQPGPPTVFPISQPPPSLPPMFDASKPPPPLPGQVKNVTAKRRTESEAGPSKVRKSDGPRVAEVACENCVQREQRIDIWKQEIEKMHCELKYQSVVYKKKLNEYEEGKQILRALVSPELYRILEDYVEGGPPQMQDLISQLSTNPVVTLLEYVFSSRNVADAGPSTSLRMDDTLTSLSAFSRVSPINDTSSDLLNSLIEALRNSNSERETRPDIESRTSTQALSESLASLASTSSTSNRYEAAPGGASTRVYPDTSAPPNSAPNVPPAAVFPSFDPGVPPPPSRGYFTPSFSAPTPLGPPSTSSMPNVPFNPRVGPPTPLPSQPPAPPNTNQYMMGRYPHPPFFPPY